MNETLNKNVSSAGPELSQRLRAVAALVTPGNTLADIGTDHAYVPSYLVIRGIVPKAAAMDVGRGPLERAEQTIARYGLESKINTRLSDGLQQLKAGEAESIVIAGMGGALTIRILEDNSMKTLERIAPKELILQPQSEIALVRQFLREHGWTIEAEDMILEDGKYYPMMRASREKPEQETAGKLEDLYGPCLLAQRHPVLRQYLEWELGVFRKIEIQLNSASGESASKRRAELNEKIQLNRQAYEKFEK